MGYYFHHKKASKIKFAAKHEIFLDYYCKGRKQQKNVLDDCDKDTYGLQQAVDFIKRTLYILSLVYDRNHYFSLGVIPKPKP